MKRLPLICSVLAVLALSASIAFWVIQLYQPAQRPLAAPPPAAVIEPAPDAAGTIFGGQQAAVAATNYTLTGVVAGVNGGAAIIVVDGKPPRAVGLGKEVEPGVTVKEIYPKYVMLADGGALKRVDLAPDNKPAAAGVGAPPMPAPQGPVEPPVNTTTVVSPPQPVAPPPAQTMTGAVPPPPPQAPQMPKPTVPGKNELQ